MQTRLRAGLMALMLLLTLALPVQAAQVDSDSIYCFSEGDFSQEALAGICITGVPESGTVYLGSRVLRCGDILTADQLAQMTFAPQRSQTGSQATLSYLPIFADRVAPGAVMTISIRGKEDKAPIAEDFAAETYKNLPLEGKLKVKDPEGEAMTFTVTRAPKRGQVTLQPDGTFTYTPKKNKVGIDSFVYTATDPAGNVSREATVTVTIVKPTEATQYTDTLGKPCRFAAEWMKNTGIFVAEQLDGNACFQPEKAVTQGEFLAMLVKTLDVPQDEQTTAALKDPEVPAWLRPYLAAAIRSGLTAGLTETFLWDAPITGRDAAVMLQNGLDLAVSTGADGQPGLASGALAALAAEDIHLSPDSALTRAEAAQALYRASKLSETAPGALIFQAQK